MHLRIPTLAVVPEDTKRMIEELKAWCDQERGRRAELSRTLGVSRATITKEFFGRAEPNWQTGLKIMAFLKKQSKAPRKQEKDGGHQS